jgi:hypothetical protein
LDIQKLIQIKLHKIISNWIFFICHPKANRTANKFIFESNEYLPQNQSKPNREQTLLTIVNHPSLKRVGTEQLLLVKRPTKPHYIYSPNLKRKKYSVFPFVKKSNNHFSHRIEKVIISSCSILFFFK